VSPLSVPHARNTTNRLTASATGGSFTWDVPDYLENDSDYALEISQGNDSKKTTRPCSSSFFH